MVHKSSSLATGSGGGTGGGTISSVTSSGSTISVTNPTGPTTNVDVANNTANTLAGFNNSGVFSDVAIGTNLSLVGGILTATAGSGAVSSVFGRTGAISANYGDYSFQLISGVSSVTQGGTGLQTLSAHGVLLGEGTANISAATIGIGGRLLIDQGAADPAFRIVSGDVSALSTGAFTVLQVNAVSYPSSPSTNTVPVVTGTNQITYESVPIAAGGTGLVSYSQGDMLYASSATTLATLAKNTSATRYLSNTGTSNNPAWAQVNLGNGVTDNLPTTNLNSGTQAIATNFWQGNGTWTPPINAVNVGVSASGTNQAAAISLVGLCSTSEITNVNSGTGVALVNGSGAREYIVNRGTNAVKVYPTSASGGSINGGAANAAVTITAGSAMPFLARDATSNWYTAVAFKGGDVNTSDITPTTLTIASNAVTNAKMATSTVNTLAGYDGSGNFSDVTVSTGLSLSGGVLTATGGGGSPGGSSGQLQWNSSGSFAGTAAGTYATSGSLFTFQAQADTDIPFTVQGHSGTQSGDLLRVSSSTATLSKFNSKGNLIINQPGLISSSIQINSEEFIANYGGIWIGQGTPTAANYSFLGNTNQTIFNNQTQIEFRAGNVTGYILDTNGGVPRSIFGYLPSSSTGDTLAAVSIVPANTNHKGLVVQANASQNSNLIEAQDSSANVLFSVGNNGAYSGSMDTMTYATTISLDVTLGNLHKTTTVNATGNATINASAVGAAGQEITVLIINDATLGKTITFGTNFKSSGTLIGTPSKGATVKFASDGINWYEIARTIGL